LVATRFGRVRENRDEWQEDAKKKCKEKWAVKPPKEAGRARMARTGFRSIQPRPRDAAD